jgi:hypothetical protein
MDLLAKIDKIHYPQNFVLPFSFSFVSSQTSYQMQKCGYRDLIQKGYP